MAQASRRRPNHNPSQLPCTIFGCCRWFRNTSGRTKHIRDQHQQILQRPAPNIVPRYPRCADEQSIDMETFDEDFSSTEEIIDGFHSPLQLSVDTDHDIPADIVHLFSSSPLRGSPLELSSPPHTEVVNPPPIARCIHRDINGAFIFLILLLVLMILGQDDLAMNKEDFYQKIHLRPHAVQLWTQATGLHFKIGPNLKSLNFCTVEHKCLVRILTP